METRDLYEELYQALMANNEPRARAILAEGADINGVDAQGWKPLLAVADEGSEDAIRLCLKLGADPAASDEDRYDVARILLQNGFCQVLLNLIDSGDLAVNGDGKGATPLMWCCCETYSEWMTEQLLARGASVQQTDEYGVTAMGYAIDADIDYSEHYPLLLKAGADINARDHDGLTFVMMLAKGENECPDSINFFLEHGADVNLRSPEGKTALGYAYDNLARCRSGEHTRMNEEWILDMMERLKARGAVL